MQQAMHCFTSLGLKSRGWASKREAIAPSKCAKPGPASYKSVFYGGQKQDLNTGNDPEVYQQVKGLTWHITRWLLSKKRISHRLA